MDSEEEETFVPLASAQHGGNITIYISKAPAEHQSLPWPEEGEGDTVTQSLS